MAARIANGRLLADAGERVRMRVYVDAQKTTAANAWVVGSPYIAHLLQDLGFTAVTVFADPPPASWRPRASGSASFPDHLVWVEATSPTNQSAIDFGVELEAGTTVTDVFDAPPVPSSSVGTPRADIITGVMLAVVAIPFIALVVAGRLRARRR